MRNGAGPKHIGPASFWVDITVLRPAISRADAAPSPLAPLPRFAGERGEFDRVSSG